MVEVIKNYEKEESIRLFFSFVLVCNVCVCVTQGWGIVASVTKIQVIGFHSKCFYILSHLTNLIEKNKTRKQLQEKEHTVFKGMSLS